MANARALLSKLARQIFSDFPRRGVVSCRRFLGDRSEEDPPVPIPNTEVKLLSPDGTAQATVWESRTSPGFIHHTKALRIFGGLFVFVPAGSQRTVFSAGGGSGSFPSALCFSRAS